MAATTTSLPLSMKSEPAIKTEGDISMSSPNNEDIYEDDQGDIDFTHYTDDVYLARLPKYLWKSWESLGDNEEIEIGTLRVEGPSEKPTAISLKLHPTIASHDNVPKEFVLQVTNANPPNTFIFTEEDLPGFNSRLKMSGKAGNDSNLPMSKAVPQGMRQAKPKTDYNKVDKTKRFQNYRRAVPKKTALAGRIQTELNCLPVENEAYQTIMKRRNAQEQKASAVKPQIAKENLSNLLSGGQRTIINNFLPKATTTKPKAQQNKAVRMAQNEILDALGQCFRQYRYWKLKDLRARLQQPEQYVKSSLALAGAHLIQSGPKVGTYALSEAAQKILSADPSILDIGDEAPDQDQDQDDKMDMA